MHPAGLAIVIRGTGRPGGCTAGFPILAHQLEELTSRQVASRLFAAS
jgi:hypothetical protein